MTYVGGTCFEGLFSNNLKNGPGRRTDHDGVVIEGVWKDDMLGDTGKLTFPCGAVYEGQLVNAGSMEGEGKMTWPGGGVYVGSYRDNLRAGRGTMTIADGTTYDGSWENDKMEGCGKLVWSNGAEYEGRLHTDQLTEGLFRHQRVEYDAVFAPTNAVSMTGARIYEATLLRKEDGTTLRGNFSHGIFTPTPTTSSTSSVSPPEPASPSPAGAVCCPPPLPTQSHEEGACVGQSRSQRMTEPMLAG